MTARLAALSLAAWAAAGTAGAEEVRVAVAANFARTLDALAPAFAEATGHRLVPSAGSTGALYAQIVQGAPYDVFLAADAERPRRLEEAGAAVAGSRFTYAVGRLVLWTREEGLADGGRARLGDPGRRVAIAEPALAPYGAAARAVLVRLGLWDGLRPRLVRGRDVGQTFQFVATGNADAGFVARSQVVAGPFAGRGSAWLVPSDWHDPIEQQAVLLGTAAERPGSRAFLAWLRSAEARAILERDGYGTARAGEAAAAPATP